MHTHAYIIYIHMFIYSYVCKFGIFVYFSCFALPEEDFAGFHEDLKTVHSVKKKTCNSWSGMFSA